jgi:hypothetical protein
MVPHSRTPKKSVVALDRAARNRANFPAFGRPAHGDTEGDTHGDSVSPSCIPHPRCKFERKYKALTDRSESTMEEFLKLFRDDYSKYGRLIKELNIIP